MIRIWSEVRKHLEIFIILEIVKRSGAGTFNALKTTGRFELPASSLAIRDSKHGQVLTKGSFKFKLLLT